MKKFLIVCVLSLLATACTWPQYHSYRQNVTISPPTSNTGGGTLTVAGETIPFDLNPKEMRVWRTAFNKSVVYKKQGFLDYEAEIRSSITGDKWATREGADASGLWLIVPTNTAYYLWDSWWKIPFGLAFDVLNIGAGIPSVILVNPWFEYEDLDLANAILTPAPDLMKDCDKNGYFISNDRCTECASYTSPVSSKEECERCPARRYENGRCYLD